MFDELRFKWVYRKLKGRQNLEGTWEFSLNDTHRLLRALPRSVLGTFHYNHIRYLSRYTAALHFESTGALLTATRTAADAVCANSPYTGIPLDSRQYDLGEWIQPNEIVFNFQTYTLALETEFTRLVEAYGKLPESRRGYYTRMTYRIVADIFTYAEAVAELVSTRKSIDGKAR